MTTGISEISEHSLFVENDGIILGDLYLVTQDYSWTGFEPLDFRQGDYLLVTGKIGNIVQVFQLRTQEKHDLADSWVLSNYLKKVDT